MQLAQPPHDWHKRNHHSADFRSVRWDGVRYFFTRTQAAIVAVLWAEAKRGTVFVSCAYLLTQIESRMSTDRIDVLFKRHPAWGVMIVRGPTRGTVGLNVR